MLPRDSVLEEHDAAVSGILPGRLRTDYDGVAFVLERLGHEVVLSEVLAVSLKKVSDCITCLNGGLLKKSLKTLVEGIVSASVITCSNDKKHAMYHLGRKNTERSSVTR